MSFSWSLLLHPLKLIAETVKARKPFSVSAAIGLRPATVVITIVNRTKDFPLHIHTVRIHFGLASYTYYFRLVPLDSKQILPGQREEYHLPFSKTVVGRRYLTTQQPNLNADLPDPSFDSPADLFKAIARSVASDTWLELDFNDFSEREFLRGKLQPLFYAITLMRPPKTNEK